MSKIVNPVSTNYFIMSPQSPIKLYVHIINLQELKKNQADTKAQHWTELVIE